MTAAATDAAYEAWVRYVAAETAYWRAFGENGKEIRCLV